MTTTFDDTMNTARKTLDDAGERAGRGASVARGALRDGLHIVASTVSVLRNLGIGDALGWFGLARARGPVFPMLTFGAGFLAGAATGLLAAPMSGVQMRRRLVARFMGIEHQAEVKLAHAKSEIEATAKHAEHAAEDAVAHGVGAVKDAVQTAFSSAAPAVTDGANGGKHPTAPGKPPAPGHAAS